MGNLHQLLAVKKDISARSNQIANETREVLGKKHLFSGSVKSFHPFEDEGDLNQVPDDKENLSYTVGDKLRWFAENFGKALDVEYQIDVSNEEAKASVEIGDFALNDVPATFLLDLIGFLERIRKVYSGIPVLDPKYEWIPDLTEPKGIFKTATPEITFKSQKVLAHKILVEATADHPAQVEKWTEDKRVGQYTKNLWSGAVTAARKAAILGRVDQLLEASKRALSEANNATHSTDKVSEAVFGFIHQGLE